MFSFTEQFSSAAKSSLQSQLTSFSALTNHAFTGMEKVLALNLAAVKASVDESLATTKQLLSAVDSKEFFSLTATQATPIPEKLTSYSRHLTEILTATRTEITREVEAQFAEAGSKVTALVEEAAKTAPSGSENAVAMLKSIITNANASYEQLSKTTKQAVETLEAHATTAADAAEKAVSDAAKQ